MWPLFLLCAVGILLAVFFISRSVLRRTDPRKTLDFDRKGRQDVDNLIDTCDESRDRLRTRARNLSDEIDKHRTQKRKAEEYLG